jgi:hypothetical protein
MSTESRVGRFTAYVASPALAVPIGSFVAGMCLWGWSRQAIAVLGTARQCWAALAITLCLAMFLAALLERGFRRKSSRLGEALTATGLWPVSVGLTALFAVFPGLSIGAALAGLSQFAGSAVLSSVVLQVGVLTLVCAIGWLMPAVGAFSLLSASAEKTEGGSKRWTMPLVLAAVGVLACEFLAAVAGGLDRSLLGAALLGTYVLATALWGMAAGHQSKQSDAADSATAQHRHVEPIIAGSGTVAFPITSVVLAALHGGLCGFLIRLLDQLLLPVSWASAVSVAAVVAGTGIGSVVFRDQTQVGRFTRLWRIVGTANPVVLSLLAGVLTVLLFEPLVWLALWVNAEVVSVFWSTLCLACIVLFVLGPVGVAVGGLVERSASSADSSARSWVMMSLPFVGSLVAAGWLAPALGHASVAVLLTVVVTAAVSLAGEIRVDSWRAVLKPQWALCAAVIVLAVCFVDPQRGSTLAARLLYDTRVFIASRIEERTETLPYLDEARCVAVEETNSGTLTVWKRRACEYEVRRSGVPLGAVSLDTFVAPHRTGETLQTVLPLCLHEDAESLLLLGAGGGSALETSVFFPLRRITCVEPDGRHVDALSRLLFSQMPLDPLQDERVSIVSADPALAMRALPDTYDLVLASGSQPAFASTVAVSSREFLTAASERLSDGGLFCQPLDIVDFGPEALGSVVETWRSVFADVTAFEIGSGRLLLVGRQGVDESDRFDGAGFIERLQRPHVRTVLASLGWDWSTVLKVMAYSDNDLRQAFAGSGTRSNSVANMAFSACLPFEVTSWGPKYQQTLLTLAQVAGTVQFMTGAAGQDPDVKRRMTDLSEQSDLIRDKPDHYWAYRARVKERIKSSPQSELVQVKGEQPYHALTGTEKRRLEYFERLGEAAQQQRPTASSLNAVAEYDSPFDPLVSPFLHQEIAELAVRDPANLGEIELWHRLHRAFFASPTDRSVRNVARALELLSEQPDLISDPASRGDCLDALLQVLHNRWHNRGEISPSSSQIVLNDIESSLASIDRAFDQLAELSAARGQADDAWQARRLAVEKSLVRPLEAYRSMLLPRHAKRQRQARQSDAR